MSLYRFALMFSRLIHRTDSGAEGLIEYEYREAEYEYEESLIKSNWRVLDDGQLAGCDKQRAGTPHHRAGVPALPLVTPYKLTNCPAVADQLICFP